MHLFDCQVMTEHVYSLKRLYMCTFDLLHMYPDIASLNLPNKCLFINNLNKPESNSSDISVIF